MEYKNKSLDLELLIKLRRTGPCLFDEPWVLAFMFRVIIDCYENGYSIIPVNGEPESHKNIYEFIQKSGLLKMITIHYEDGDSPAYLIDRELLEQLIVSKPA